MKNNDFNNANAIIIADNTIAYYRSPVKEKKNDLLTTANTSPNTNSDKDNHYSSLWGIFIPEKHTFVKNMAKNLTRIILSYTFKAEKPHQTV